MQTEKLGIGISIRGIDANVATAAEMSTIKDLLSGPEPDEGAPTLAP